MATMPARFVLDLPTGERAVWRLEARSVGAELLLRLVGPTLEPIPEDPDLDPVLERRLVLDLPEPDPALLDAARRVDDAVRAQIRDDAARREEALRDLLEDDPEEPPDGPESLSERPPVGEGLDLDLDRLRGVGLLPPLEDPEADVPRETSPTVEPDPPRVDGRPCPDCSEWIPGSPQALGAHRRHAHPNGTKTRRRGQPSPASEPGAPAHVPSGAADPYYRDHALAVACPACFAVAGKRCVAVMVDGEEVDPELDEHVEGALLIRPHPGRITRRDREERR